MGLARPEVIRVRLEGGDELVFRFAEAPLLEKRRSPLELRLARLSTAPSFCACTVFGTTTGAGFFASTLGGGLRSAMGVAISRASLNVSAGGFAASGFGSSPLTAIGAGAGATGTGAATGAGVATSVAAVTALLRGCMAMRKVCSVARLRGWSW